MSVVELLSSLAKKDIRLWLEGENLRFSAPEGAFTAEIRDQIISKKPQIIEFLKQAQKLKKKGIPVASRERDLPVSYGQQRLWLLDQINPNDTTYNIPAAFRIKGQISPAVLEKAFATLVERHESLRTKFADAEGEPIQVIEPFSQWTLPLVDLTHLEESAREHELRSIVKIESRTPFDLKTGPLLRIQLVILQEGDKPEYALVTCMHHIISDAWSMEVLVKEMAACYKAASTGAKAALEPLPIQYADYAVWQRSYMEDEAFKEDLNYWHEHLTGVPPVLDIPTDLPRPDLLSSRGATHEFKFSDKLAAQIDTFCKQQDLTPYMVTLGAWQLLLSRYADSDDVVVGAPVAGRDRHETQDLIGFFVNLLLLRLKITGRPTVKEFYALVKEMVLGGFNHQEVPIDILLETMDVERQPGYPPLAQAAFQLLVQEGSEGGNNFGGGLLDIEAIPNESVSARMDMTLGIVKSTHGYQASLEFNTDLFNTSTINNLMEQYQFLLGALTENVDQIVDEIHLFDDAFLLTHLGCDSTQNAIVALNANQKAMLIDQMVNPDTVQNGYGIYVEFPRTVDLDILTKAIEIVAAATPMARAQVKACDIPAADEAYLVIPNAIDIKLQHESLADKSEHEREEYLESILHRAYDIFSEPLVSYHWLPISEESALFVISYHHIVADGASTYAHLGKIVACYENLKFGQRTEFKDDDAFQDYLAWENAHGNTTAIHEFWKTKLAETEALNFTKPRDGHYEPSVINNNSVIKLIADGPKTEGIRQFCKQNNVTVPAYFRTLYGLMLLNYCRPDESFSIFDFYANRRQVTDQNVGCFYQQYPVIFDKQLFSSETPLQDWFQSSVDFNQLTKAKRVISIADQRAFASLGSALFMFNFYSFTAKRQVEGKDVLPYMSAPRVEGGVQLIARDIGEMIELELRYDPRVFSDCHFVARLFHLSEQITNGEVKQLGQLNYLSAGELAKLLHWSLSDNLEPAEEGTIVDWFYEQVAKTPGNVALIEGDKRLTYQELNEQSNQLAHWLREQGVDSDTRVGLCFERSLEYVVAVWGVLKAGGVYVPMDASYPEDRLAYIVNDSEARVIITHKRVADNIPTTDAVVCVIDGEHIELASLEKQAPSIRPQPNNQIYAIYTSGSTGLPKGALVTHEGEANLQSWYLNTLSLDSMDSSLLVSAIGFDLTQKNIFAALLRGGKLVIPQMDLFDEQYLVDTIKKHQITFINCAPSAFYPVVQSAAANQYEALRSLRYVVLGGEPIQLQLLDAWLSHPQCESQLMNSYGPTECTDVVSYHILENFVAKQTLIPIGKPIENAQLFVLNEFNQMVVPGLVGELCIGGLSVGLGYINKQELTDKAFIENPYGEGKLYRSGDLVRYLANGDLEYIGRKDFQIKLRGLRIELGEIETALKSLPDVNDGLVLLKNEQLIGYVVTNNGDDIVAWRELLKALLPDYMVPSALVVLAEWPLTPNGKVDRKALPDATLAKQNYVAPRNEVENQTARIWQEVLEKEQVGVLDNLFDIGGNSLLATRILSRVRRAFGVDVTVRELFQGPTVAGLANAIKRCQRIGDIPSLQAEHRPDNIPLSFAQQRIWLLDQLDPGNAAYNMPVAVRLQGDVQPRILEKVFNEIVRRHEGFRTRFAIVDDAPVQLISEHINIELPVEDLSHLEVLTANSIVENRALEEAAKPFDLTTGPLLRVQLIKLTETDYVLIANKHHIISDGWSMGILMHEIATLYGAFSNLKASPLPELTIQYADFAIWQRGWLQGEVLEQQIGYWKTKLANVPVLSLSTDFPRSNKLSQRGDAVEFSLSQKLTKQLEVLSQENGSTLYITLLAAFQTLLYRYTNQHDVVVGSPIANRNWSELEPIIGFFVNTLAFRSQLDPKQSFTDFLYQVEQTALEAYDHQDIPFERLVDELGIERSLTHTPIFQVLFTFQNISESSDFKLPGLTLTPMEASSNESKFELMLNMGVNNGQLNGVFAFRTALYRKSTIQQISKHFTVLLESIVAAPTQALCELPMLDQSEIDQQLVQWNQTQVVYDKTHTVHTLIDLRCAKTPTAVAVQYGEDVLTYQALNDRANQIARLLVKHGVKPNDRVGLCFDRHLQLIPAILGILKAGGTYVPLDASYPEGRIRYIAEDAAINLVVTREELAERLPQGNWTLLALDGCDGSYIDTEDKPLHTNIEPDAERLLYVIYTSGSTGRPKGAGAYQRSGINLLNWYIKEFSLQPKDVVMLMSAIGFDLTQKNLFAPLIAGAKLVIPDFQEFDPALLLDTIERNGVTWINGAPSSFYPLQDNANDWHKLSSVSRVFLGGEPINLPRLQEWLEQANCQVTNSYGPTECTDVVSYYKVNLNEDLHHHVLPIGRPINNVRLYLLGEANELMPVGAVGELYIGGDSIGAGYLNNKTLTDAVFIKNPFTETTEIIYKTGDYARYRHDGLIEYLGRRDHQVKLRGFRIEVEEIQAVVNEFEGVTDCLIAVEKTAAAGEQLFAWIIAAESLVDDKAWLESLQTHAENMLASHMLPNVWHVLAKFPLTPNGKIDRKALPKEVGEATDVVLTPETQLQKEIASIWEAVLGIQAGLIGTNQNFFQLGGHSLLATQVISRIRTRYGVELPLRDLFENPTVGFLAQAIEQQQAQGIVAAAPGMSTVDRTGALPLSFSQQRLWVLDQIEPESNAYNMPAALRLVGKLDKPALQAAFECLIDRHESLRTLFVELDGKGAQVVQEKIEFYLTEGVLEDKTEAGIKQASEAFFEDGFDLANGPLFRAKLLTFAENDHVLLTCMHHIISDGWSMGILISEVGVVYNALSKGLDSPLSALRYQYADYAVWQQNWLTGDVLKSQLDFWKHTLADVPVLELPTDYVRQPTQSYRGAHYQFELNESLTAGLNRLATQQGATLYMVLMASFGLLLNRYSHQDDFAIGMPVANRTSADVESIMGFFVNTLSIRADLLGEPSFSELINRFKNQLISAYDYQDVPFEKLVDELNVARDMSHSPIFQVMFVLQNTQNDQEVPLGDLTIKPVDWEQSSAKFDLTLSCNEVAGKIFANFEFATDLFKTETIARMADHFKEIITSVIADPSQPVTQVNLLTGSEKHTQLIEWNNTQVDYDRHLMIHRWFEQQAARSPNNTAIVYAETELTYNEFNRRANQLAHLLQTKGVSAGDLVGICMTRSADLIVAVFATLKAGATYVPMDPNYPQERLEYLATDSNAKIILTESSVKDRLPTQLNTLCVDAIDSELLQQRTENLETPDDSSRLLYLIYTSGSTGKPKCTGAYHRSEVNLLTWYCGEFDFSATDRVALISAFGFDLTQKNIFAPLVSGGTLVIPAMDHYDPAIVASTIQQQKVTWVNCAPSAFYPLVDIEYRQKVATLRCVFLGGESIALSRLADWHAQSGCQLINSYGPTECTDIGSYHIAQDFSQYPSGNLPIGKPNYNVRLYIINGTNQLAPVGVPGELCIGGESVGPGYINDQALTADKFIENPFTGDQSKLYRTGDLARLLPDGNVEYLGRIDNQVKLRGFRIELGEIENTLRSIDGVKDAAVIIREDSSNNQLLCAYLVFDDKPINATDVRALLKVKLPEFMVPQAYVAMDTLPLTPNGKVNIKALPEPLVEAVSGEYAAPSNAAEEALVAIWQDVLGVGRIGVHDNFFELGGDSILGIQIINRAKKAGYHLSAKNVFQCQTIAELAEVVEDLNAVKANLITEQGLVEGDVGLTPVQKWFFNENFADAQHYNQSVMLTISQPVSKDHLLMVFNALIAQHDALRMQFVENDQIWLQQHYNDVIDANIEYQDLSDITDDKLKAEIEQRAAMAQGQLSLSDGLMKVLYLDLGHKDSTYRGARLLIIIHHLVVDGVSWRVLLEDMQKAFAAIKANHVIDLGEKGTSFRQWSDCLQTIATSELIQSESNYWKTISSQPVTPLPIDHQGGHNTVATARRVNVVLDERQTTRFLQNTHQAYNTEINDLLLAALGKAMTLWHQGNELLVTMEGHGREDIVANVDITRTVGWFTTKFPVYLQINELSDADLIKSVKEQLRVMPNKGVGFGLLKYFTANSQDFQNNAQIVFNYLGQFDQVQSDTSEESLIGIATEHRGRESGNNNHMDHLLDVSGGVSGHRLSFDWSYSAELYEEETVIALANSFIEELSRLIDHCDNPDIKGYTPSDFSLVALSQGQLDELLDGRDDVKDLYPMSPMQEGMLFHALYSPGSSVYFEQMSAEINGELDKKIFLKAWDFVVQRHPILRTAFLYEGLDRPLQCVHKTIDVAISDVDWRDKAFTQDEEQIALDQLFANDRAKGFDFNKPGVTRLTFIQLPNSVGGSRSRLLWSYHHMLLDGWSVPIVLGELFQTYEAMVEGGMPSFGRSPNYKDYIELIEARDRAEQANYWKSYLGGFENTTPITFKRNLKVEPVDFVNNEFKVALDLESTKKLEQLSRNHHITLNTTLQAAWAIVLARYAGESDIVFGATVSGRPAELNGVEQMVGLFINTLPVRAQLDPQQKIIDCLNALQNQQLEQRHFEHTPLIDIKSWSELPADQNLFDSLFVFENFPVSEALEKQNDGLSLEVGNLKSFEETSFPLTVTVSPGSKIQIKIAYDENRFENQVITEVAERFVNILKAIAKAPNNTIGDLPFLSEKEIHQQLIEWNQTDVAYDKTLTVHQLIEQQAQATPNNIAVVCGGESLSYADLIAQANHIATALIEQGVNAGDKVGLCFDRHLSLMPSILGILKAGATYIPLDASYPAGRIQYIAEDASINIVLSRSEIIAQLAQGAWQPLAVDQLLKDINSNLRSVCVAPDSERLLYMIYTSGSTGRPKGTGAYHRSEINLLSWYCREFGLTANDSVLLMSAIGFDLTQKNLFAPLAKGAKLVIPSFQEYDPQLLIDTIQKHSVTWVNCAPSAFYPIQDEEAAWGDLKTLKQVFLGGEPINLARLTHWLSFSKCQLINSYGPTECTDIAAWYRVDIEKDIQSPMLPIGRPNDNVQLYVLDESNSLLPIGAVGELCIGGDGVGPGYLNNSELTQASFIQNPLSNDPDIIYKTGDLVRYREDGLIEYLGRRDHQVKLRGYRIEVEEVQSVINEFEQVTDCLVAVEKIGGAEQLLAWVVTQNQENINESQRAKAWLDALQNHCANMLASHMLPNVWQVLDKFPLTPNGKIDRKALPRNTEINAIDKVLPRNDTEKTIADIWQQVLAIESIGVNDSFFDLGGHSLLATQVISRIRKQFNVDIPLRKLFDSPTVAAMALLVENPEGSGSLANAPDIVPVPRGPSMPLSYGQQRMWILSQLEPNSPAYNMPAALRMKGDINLAALEKALASLEERHESLRTTFITEGDHGAQVIHQRIGIAIEQRSLGGASEADIKNAAEEEFSKPFDLKKGPLLRVVLLHVASDEYVLLTCMHHIISDGWSMALLIGELAKLYAAYSQDISNPLAPLELQYADFSAWQQSWLVGDVLDAQIDYWRHAMQNVPAIDLPTDFARPPAQTYRGAHHKLTLNSDLIEPLNRVAQAQGATLFMSLMASFSVLLNRYSSQEDFAIGTPIANRNSAETEAIMGFFVNTLSLRADLSNNPSFNETLRRIKSQSLSAYDHQDVPFEKIVDELNVARDMSRSPLFQVMFVLQNTPSETAINLPGVNLSTLAWEQNTSKFDLTLTCTEIDGGLVADFEYATDLFRPDTIERMAKQFRQIISEVTSNPDVALNELALLTEEEAAQLKQWNNTHKSFRDDVCVHRLLEEQAERTPQNVAVISGDAQLNYQDFNGRANQVARMLQQQGVQAGDLVGVCMPRCADLIVCVYAVLKAGATYVPMDPGYPEERLTYLATDSQAKVVITTGETQQKLPASINQFCIDNEESRIVAQDNSNLTITDDPERLLYLIYTSGSTGKPKCTGAYHRSELNLLDWYSGEFNMNENDRIVLMSAFGFDLTQKNIFAPFCTGAGLIVPQYDFYDPDFIADQIQQYGGTWLNCAPSAFYPLVEEGNQAKVGSLRAVFLGGEPISLQRLTAWYEQANCQLINSYGPTECTDIASFYVASELSQYSNGNMPIGKPNHNVQLYVLTQNNQHAPIGVAGELCIGGDSVGPGYLNDPALTAEKFIPNLLVDDGSRMYRTGDLARFLPNGDVEYLGRMDNQVKIRGFRIELGEIENAIRELDSVRECAVIAREDEPGHKYLAAYIVSDAELDSKAMRLQLTGRLPVFMVPAAYVAMDVLPLTPNGKVNAKALPKPEENMSATTEYVAPRTEIEEQVVEIWCEILKKEKLGIKDDFFEVGGHSLLATQIVNRVKAKYDIDFPLKALFEATTIEAMSNYIETTLWAKGDLADEAVDEDDEDMEEFEI